MAYLAWWNQSKISLLYCFYPFNREPLIQGCTIKNTDKQHQRWKKVSCHSKTCPSKMGPVGDLSWQNTMEESRITFWKACYAFASKENETPVRSQDAVSSIFSQWFASLTITQTVIISHYFKSNLHILQWFAILQIIALNPIHSLQKYLRSEPNPNLLLSCTRSTLLPGITLGSLWWLSSGVQGMKISLSRPCSG